MDIPLGGDSAYFLDLYGRYRQDQLSVPADWRLHFESMADAPGPASASLAARLLETYRQLGHREADLDPLGLTLRRQTNALNRLRAAAKPLANDTVVLSLGGQHHSLALGEMQAKLHSLYAGTIGLEASHLDDEAQQDWLYAEFEACLDAVADEETKGLALESIGLADTFESFLAVKFPAKKRFGIEGAETLIVLLREMLKQATIVGVTEIVMGGMHRGRLVTLATVLGKPVRTLLSEIKGKDLTGGSVAYTGDVPYHLGYAGQVDVGGRSLQVTLAPHPSHLTAVVPVALGLAHGLQSLPNSGGKATILSVALHTDAAFSGQGLASEVMQLGGLPGYSVGGTIHIVVNNQIGFTTLPSEARSGEYCTDIGKSVGVPILHVNGDDPVAVARVAQLALRWRQKFGKDILIDLLCYRRNGHNEIDEPRFTQPDIWAAIDARPKIRHSFGEQVAAAHPNLVTATEEAEVRFRMELQAAYDSIATSSSNAVQPQSARWVDMPAADEHRLLEQVPTGLDLNELRDLGRIICRLPEGLNANPKVARFYQARLDSIETGEGINFATAEALAFASLLREGTSIRLAGQDTVRGAFTQRHLAVHDMATGLGTMPLAAAGVACFDAINSPLSEYAAIGFEYGSSLADPRRLVLWEAQFGDFLNGAQIIVDQFIVSAEAKWGVQSGFVALLPHGLEGQGPDHSSARIERLLQMCSGGNVILANPSTPANLFHALRRQITAPWRKPMLLIAPKSLLRAKACVSSLAEFRPGTGFQPVIDEAGRSAERLILCSGKVFYALHQARQRCGLDDKVALVRVEQLYPFPADALRAVLAQHNPAQITWCQEEPENQGGWYHIQRELSRLRQSSARPLQFAGRPAMPVPAGGSIDRHDIEQTALLAQALGVPPSALA